MIELYDILALKHGLTQWDTKWLMDGGNGCQMTKLPGNPVLLSITLVFFYRFCFSNFPVNFYNLVSQVYTRVCQQSNISKNQSKKHTSSVYSLMYLLYVFDV